jgi:hypothetical protein
MVAVHAIYRGTRWEPANVRDEANWFLEQSQHGHVDTFLAQIRKGVELAANDTSSILLFSGGQTRLGLGPRSEGTSYWQAADAFDWFGMRDIVQNRSHAEEYARDSLENLLFSVCRFKQLSGSYPRYVKVVSMGYKEQRFVTLHRKALRFPLARFEYFGIDPPNVAGMRDSLYSRERSMSMGPFAKDPYGCKMLELLDKRIGRNPYIRYHPYPQGCPSIAGLFEHCGPSIFDGALPWDLPRLQY